MPLGIREEQLLHLKVELHTINTVSRWLVLRLLAYHTRCLGLLED